MPTQPRKLSEFMNSTFADLSVRVDMRFQSGEGEEEGGSSYL
jgi:hypothetical protein